mgnify:FL=1
MFRDYKGAKFVVAPETSLVAQTALTVLHHP